MRLKEGALCSPRTLRLARDCPQSMLWEKKCDPIPEMHNVAASPGTSLTPPPSPLLPPTLPFRTFLAQFEGAIP